MIPDDLIQYINSLSNQVGRIADNNIRSLNEVRDEINNVNNTLATTNVLLAVFIVVLIINTILKWKRK